MATTKKTTKKTEKKPKYTLAITINGETAELKGDDILSILQSYPQPDAIKTDMDIVASHDKKSVEYVVAIRDARRTFHNGTKMELLAINLNRRLG